MWALVTDKQTFSFTQTTGGFDTTLQDKNKSQQLSQKLNGAQFCRSPLPTDGT